MTVLQMKEGEHYFVGFGVPSSFKVNRVRIVSALILRSQFLES